MRRFELSDIARRIVDVDGYSGGKKWIRDAIKAEEKKPEKSLWLNAPTPKCATDARMSTVRRLGRRDPNSENKSAIIRLANCSVENRCCCGACPVCARLFQRAFVRAARHYIHKRRLDQGEGKLVAITIIPADAKAAPGDLEKVDLRNFVRRAKSNLKNANVRVAVGCVDFSFNEDRDGLYEPHWCPHVHMIGWTRNVKKLRADLKRYVPGDGVRIPKPAHVQSSDGDEYGISYHYKIRFGRRVTYDGRRVTYYNPKKGRRETPYSRLSADQNVELSLYLDKVGLGSRLILMGLKAYVRRGGLRLKHVGP